MNQIFDISIDFGVSPLVFWPLNYPYYQTSLPVFSDIIQYHPVHLKLAKKVSKSFQSKC